MTAKPKSPGKQPRLNHEGSPAFNGVPNVGEILKRLRTQRKLSIRDVAAGSGLSASFLSAVERGESDVAIGSLALIAQFFDHDVGSMLGFSSRLSRPNFLSKNDRSTLSRGKGIRYELLRLPGLNLELALISFAPKSSFRDELTHEGIDAVYVLEGEIVLRISDQDYRVPTGECVVYSAAYPHTMRNESPKPAKAVGVTTAHM